MSSTSTYAAASASARPGRAPASAGPPRALSPGRTCIKALRRHRNGRMADTLDPDRPANVGPGPRRLEKRTRSAPEGPNPGGSRDPPGLARLRRDRWPALGPGRRLLELRGEPHEHVLAAVPRDELDADRQPVGAPVQRQGDCGLAGHVELRRVGDERRDPP